MQATEERKLVTVLFADIVGSTALASEQDPERVRALMDRFYETMQEEIAASGGTVEKFAGDAVLASFGAPAAQEDHAERALHTALSVCRRVKELFGEQLAIRVGVNTGEVVVGPARAGGSFLTGDAVNVAARLEQGAEPAEIPVGERTVAAVRGAFEFDEPAAVEAKRKPGGVVCSRLVRAVTLMRPRGSRAERPCSSGGRPSSRHLTPHHRVHGMSMVVETEESVGDWEAIREVTPTSSKSWPITSRRLACETRAPCSSVPPPTSTAATRQPRRRSSGRLTNSGSTSRRGSTGLRIRIALARGDLDAVRTLVDEMEPAGRLTFGLQSAAARFDALAILRAREEAEAEAPRLLQSGTFLEPFALRALGIVRDDEVLIAEAQEHFKALGLDWHAAQTEVLVQQP